MGFPRDLICIFRFQPRYLCLGGMCRGQISNDPKRLSYTLVSSTFLSGTIMKACVVFHLVIGLVSCLAKVTDLTEKEKRSACSDSLDTCAAYPKSVCSDPTYQAWAKDNCKSYCNLCPSVSSGGVTPLLPGASSACSDSLNNCAAYPKSVCSDTTYQAWAKDNCKSYCNLCPSGGSGGVTTPTPPLPGTSSPCSDSLDNCAAYPKSVCSDTTYQAWAKENCKSYCNLCSSGSGGGGTPSLPDTSSSCSDKLLDCSGYGPSACQNYQQWAQENCANTCNMCSSSGGGGSPTGNGGGMTGTSAGCVYDGKVYQQGQTWKDACKYSCECEDGTSGKYQCRALCLTWNNLPSSCHMNPPAPGKCCPQPACPPSITLQYPPGYTPQ